MVSSGTGRPASSDGGYAAAPIACTPTNRDGAITPTPFANLTSSYVLRAIDQFPKQGSRAPWQREQNYARNLRSMQRAPLDDPALEFAA